MTPGEFSATIKFFRSLPAFQFRGYQAATEKQLPGIQPSFGAAVVPVVPNLFSKARGSASSTLMCKEGKKLPCGNWVFCIRRVPLS